MRNLTLTIILLGSTVANAYAIEQTNESLFQQGAVWSNITYDMSKYTFFRYTLDGDTTINEKEYKKMYEMKQNFLLHYFYGENETAIRTQVWCTLIAQLLMTVLQKKANMGKAFSIVATLVRIHLISMLDVFELICSMDRRFERARGAPSGTGQLAFDWA